VAAITERARIAMQRIFPLREIMMISFPFENRFPDPTAQHYFIACLTATEKSGAGYVFSIFPLSFQAKREILSGIPHSKP